MLLRDRLIKEGHWVFKWRSYLPLALLPAIALALPDSLIIERTLGQATQSAFDVLCISVTILGLVIRFFTATYVPKSTSGRNTTGQKAESLNTTGLYSVVRNPLYLGNFFAYLGLALFIQVWWFVLILIMAFYLEHERIVLTEEDFLSKKFGADYKKWALTTPAFIPKLKNWKRPELEFSLRSAIRREFPSLMIVCGYFTALHFAQNVFVHGSWSIEAGWLKFFFTGLIIYVVLFVIKKKTRILRIKGR
ncbi:MAG: DUF1295 domain-containing protein [Deltaproteobacteria bacterium]|nr:DUF1295 domain-containing protein [Deltaproteobacteria bacterium]